MPGRPGARPGGGGPGGDGAFLARINPYNKGATLRNLGLYLSFGSVLLETACLMCDMQLLPIVFTEAPFWGLPYRMLHTQEMGYTTKSTLRVQVPKIHILSQILTYRTTIPDPST